MAKWTLETADAAASQAKGGGYAPTLYLPPGIPQEDTAVVVTGGIITERNDTLGGGRPMILPPPPQPYAGCTSGCGVPYPNSSPATVVPGTGATVTERAADTVQTLLSGWKSWPWWVWLVIGLVVMLLLRR